MTPEHAIHIGGAIFLVIIAVPVTIGLLCIAADTVMNWISPPEPGDEYDRW
jgi:hypothetical protein